MVTFQNASFQTSTPPSGPLPTASRYAHVGAIEWRSADASNVGDEECLLLRRQHIFVASFTLVVRPYAALCLATVAQHPQESGALATTICGWNLVCTVPYFCAEQVERKHSKLPGTSSHALVDVGPLLPLEVDACGGWT